jgi:hypothetical protein
MKISKHKHITKDGVVKNNPAIHEIGDGKLPNKYWVSESNDFYICVGGQCDWASEKLKDYKIKHKTHAKQFKTFKEALEFANELSAGMYGEPTTNSINNVVIEDRLSGQIYEISVYGYPIKDSVVGGYTWSTEERIDTQFTEQTMAKKGLRFE